MDPAVITLPIECACGAVTAEATHVSPATVNRVVCHCRGCQGYAHALERAPEILDPWGGTDVFQMSPAHLKFKTGHDEIAWLRMTSKGALRWHTRCCNTPIAHTLASRGIPFMAINHRCVNWTRAGVDRQAALGPIRARVNGRFPRAHAVRSQATIGALLRMLGHYSPLLLGWWWRGDHRRSPFFDEATGMPIAEPRVMELPAARSPARLPSGCG